MDAEDLAHVRPGAVIAGKYLVERVLGEGGMGVVVAARHASLGHRVAIKLLRAHVFRDPTEALVRFGREARIEAGASNEHIARVDDVGALDDGTPYMVMEHLDGATLRQTLAARGPLPVAEALELMRQACVGVGAAHDAGVVHRNLNPNNLFVTHRPDGAPLVKVLDFGIAKLAGAAGDGRALTGSTTLMGTPVYMAPEQMRSARDADARADVWSLGAILHELLAGAPAFSGETMAEVWAAVYLRAPTPLSSIRADVPARVEAIVLRCLAKDRAERYASARELGRDIERFSRELELAGMDTIRAFGPPPSRGSFDAAPPSSASPARIVSAPPVALAPPPRPPLASGRWAVALVAGAIVLALAAITVQRAGAPRAAATPDVATSRALAASPAPPAPIAVSAPAVAPVAPVAAAPERVEPKLSALASKDAGARAPSAALAPPAPTIDAGAATTTPEAWPWGDRQ